MKIGRVGIMFCFLLMLGCAVTGVTKQNQLLAKPIEEVNWSKNYTVEVNCPAEIKSISISPFLPLPPIIPMGLLNEDRIIVNVQTPHEVHATAKVLDAEGVEASLPIDIEIWTGNKYGRSEKITWTFRVGMSCEDIEGHVLLIEIEGSEGGKATAKFSLEYVPGDLKLESGYISA
jgi:hypothetical protein